MPTTSKYFITNTVAGQNWLDFSLNIDQLTLSGQEFVFTGSSSVDAVKVGPGAAFDFTKSNGGIDKLFLFGNLSDYTLSFATSTVTLQRGSGLTAEKLVLAKGTSTNFDQVVFANGTASTFDLHALAAGTQTSLTLGAVQQPPTVLNATVKAFALDPNGEVFAPSAPGMNYIVTGSNAVDMVYVSEGAVVDATKLNGGIDEIYFTRSWADYTKTVSASKVVFTHAASGETVTVAAATGAANDRLVFADGSVQTNDAKAALNGNVNAALGSVTGFDASKTTPGLAPRITSSIDGVSNLDVTSALVLKVNQAVTAVAGKFIRIVDEGGAGFNGESTARTQEISVTDTSKISIQGGLITIRPGFDLDLSSNYHIEIDSGAFVNSKGRGNAAVTDPTALNFSTVTPGSGLTGVGSAAASQAMDTATGNLVASFNWLDIQGVGSPSSSAGVVVDVGAANVALVFKDYDSAGGSSASDGVGAPDFYVRANNFGAGDLLYIDNQNPAVPNRLDSTTVLAETPGPGITQLSFGSPPDGGLGGVVEIDLAGTNADFANLDQLKTLLNVSYQPVGERAASAAPPTDPTPPTLQSATVAADGRTVTLVFSETLDAASVTAAQMLSRFTVAVGQSNSVAIESVVVSGSQVVLTVPAASPIPSAASLGAGTVRLSYTDPSTGNETVNVLQDAAGNDVATITNYTVLNNSAYTPPAAITIQSLNASDTVVEGASVTYTVTLSGAAPSGGFVVDWQAVPATTGDPAEAQDFGTGASSVFPTGSVTIAAGQTTGQIVLPVFDDTLAEGQEAFVLQVGKLTAGNFTSAAQWFTSINPSDQSTGPDGFVTVNPKGTWLADAVADPAQAPTQVLLSTFGAAPGSVITLTRTGDYQAGNGTGLTDSSSSMVAVFVDAQGNRIAPQTFLGQTTLTQSSGLVTNVSEDFWVVVNAVTRVVVPVGAVALQFSVNDSFFSDNSDPDGDFGVTVRVADAATNYGGNDQLFGTSGADTIQGGDGADSLAGGSGNDQLTGGLGNDVFYGGAGSDVMSGGEQRTLPWSTNLLAADFDRLEYAGSPGGITVDLSARTVVVAGQEGTDTYSGIEEIDGVANVSDVVTGRTSASATVLDGTSINLYLRGGSDVVNQAPLGYQQPWADGAFVYYNWSQTGIQAVATANNQISVSYGAAGSGSTAQLAGTDTLTHIFGLTDTAQNDTFDLRNLTIAQAGYVTTQGEGVSPMLLLIGRGGSDTVMGNGRTYMHFGAVGSTSNGQGLNIDLLLGTANISNLSTNSIANGTVTFSGVNGLFGTRFNDTMLGGVLDSFELFRGSAGDDYIDGRTGYDRADYRNANEGITVNLAQGVATSLSEGTDTLRSIEEIRGSQFADVFDARGFTGGGTSTTANVGSYWWGQNAFVPDGGNDTIYGNGSTRLNYSAAMVGVRVNLAEGVADARLESDKSTLGYYNMGRDTFSGVYAVIGSSLDDELIGGGAGRTSTGVPVEVFTGGAGADTINGAGGEDIASYDSSPTGIVVDLSLSSGQVQDGWGFIDTLISVEQVIGSQHADSMKGGAGNESFEGRRGQDTVDGGAGYDEVSFAGEAAGVTVRLGGWVGATGGLPTGFQGSALDGSGGIDVFKNVEGVEGSNYADQIFGDAGDNRLDGRGGNDTIDGGAGIDWVEYNQAMRAVHVDLSQGKAFDDGQGVGDAAQDAAVEQDTLLNIENVLGGFGADTLVGSAGDNVLEGGAGNDTLDGGGGTDTARFTGNRADYNVTFDAGTATYTVTDTVTGRDGVDTVRAVERAVFTNGAYVFSGGNLVPEGGPDTTPPTLTITTPNLQGGKILAGNYVTVNFNFSEAVTGFDLGDVGVTNGVLSNLYKVSDTAYSAGFQPNGGVDGSASFSVAAGAFSDAAGNASTVAANLSVPMATAQPGNSGGTTFTVPTSGNSEILVRFSEPIFEKTAGALISGFNLTLNPSASNGFQGTGTAPQITGFTPGEGSSASGYTLLTLQTNTVFAQSDVVRVSINGYSTNFRDADGNALSAQDVYVGGSAANTIDLDGYWSSSRQILRGNGGNDTLDGTDNADSIIDGGGADVIDPLWGGDSITLVENGSTGSTPIPYARDEILIGLGETRRGVGNTDFIGFDTSNSASGFDWFSTTAGNHDVLQMESGVIGTASSFTATPAAQGVITGHTLSGGIVSFQGASGAVTIRQDNTSLGNALDYLRFNLQAAGHTVAFKADYDNNGVVESLFVYQDVGTLPLAGNAEMPDIVVRIAQPGDTAAARLASVTLGNAPGANVLEIQDGFSPEPAMVGLTANGVQLNFVEPMFAPATASALGMSLKVNGTGTAYTPATVTGAGTSVITVQANGLAMNATDWALVTYSGSSSANALRDTSGKLLAATDDNGNPSSFTFALGSSGNNTIDLSGYAVTGWGLDIEAGAGDDLVTGTASHDYIVGGTGADTLRGGAGEDSFQFEQGDSPVLTLNTSVATDTYMLTGATYTFAGGKVEVIENLEAGDQVWLNPPFEGVTGSPWLSMMGGTSSPGNNGLVTNQGYFGVRGTLGANGVFTVGTYNNSPDTLVVYDGDGSSGVSQTGFVLKGVPMGDLEGLMYGSQPIRLRAPTAVNGTEGNDTLNGTYAADVINGLGGDDYLNGNEGNDTLDGGSGNDIAGYWSTWQSTPLNFTSTWRTSGGLQADGLGGTDTLINIEELHFGGGMGNDTLMGDTGRNYIEGTSGNDTMTGGGGNDTFGYSPGQGAQGDDTVTDFSGDDQLWFNGLNITSLTAGANAGSLMAGEASIVVGAGQTTLHVGTDSTAGADLSITLTGSFLASGFSRNLITFGGVVNTEIRYASGEFFVGTSGADSRNGGDGNDTLEGREGNDSLTGMAGNDILRGEAGNDQLRGEDGNDTLEGGDGNDYMTGGLGNDSLVGGAGADTADYYFLGNPTGSLGPLTVNLTTGLATGGQGNDTLSGIENVNGTDSNDVITGDANNNFLEGRGGNDTISAGAGWDTVAGGLGDDSLDGGTQSSGGTDFVDYRTLASAVTVNLETGRATGGGGNDTLTGFEGVIGTDGNDTLVGSNSTTLESEVLAGGKGNDSIDGGAGFDIADFTWGNTAALTVDLSLGTATGADIGSDTLLNIEGVISSAGNDSLKGSDGDNWFRPQGGNDTVDGGGGIDRVVYDRASAAVAVNLGLTTEQDTKAEGLDTLINIENLRGSGHNDTLTGSNIGNNIQGRSGNDSIRGMEGDDSIFGEDGNDSIDGGDGNDSLNGGLGADRFFLGQDAGSDTIDGGGYITRTPWPSFLTVPNNGDDYDRLVYSNAASGINLNMTTRTVTVGGMAGTDTYTNIEEVQGTTKSDTVVGKPSEGASFLFMGMGGSDTITQETYGLVGGRWADGLQVGYSWSETGLIVNWTGNQATVAYGAGTGTLNSGAGAYAAGTDTLTNILYIQTSNYDDVVNGQNATLNHLGYLTNPFREISYFIVAVRGGNDVIQGSGNFLLIPEVNTIAAAAPANGVGITVDGRAPGADGLLLMDMTHLKAPVSETTAHGTVKFSGVSYVFGTPWADTVHAGNGIYDFRGQGGNDSFYGDENNNLSSYRSSNNGVSVNLAQGTVADLTGGTSSGTDTLRGVEMIEGTRFNDVFDAQGFSELSVNAGGTASIWKGMTNWYTPMGGNDTVTGNGYTRLGFTSAMMGIDANLAEGYVDSLATDAATRASPEYLYTVGRTTFTGVYGVGGTDYADRLVGSNGGGAIGTTLAEGFDPRGGADTVDGQGGFDTVFYSSAPNAIQVDLTLLTGQVVQDGWGSSDTLLNIERVEGSHRNDTFLGNDGDNSFRGLRGSDSMDGGAGDDQADYQAPRLPESSGVVVDLGGTAVRSQAVLAATPAQLPTGFTGWSRDNWGDIDFLKSMEGIGGSDWDDVLIGSDGNNRLGGRDGADTVDGAGGVDWAEYNGAEAGVTVSLALGQATNDGAGYVDTLISIENLRGSVFNDSLVGDVGANQFKGESGNDTIIGGAGTDLATYVGARADYNVVFDSGILTLTDNVAGRDGVDTVSEVERFDFAGVFYALNGLGQLVLEPAPT